GAKERNNAEAVRERLEEI
uniref:Conantokin-Gm n=1 Tax=Conus gloriamaris TaxID=37336 RepID=CKG_CONGL|nr:RecName: Full=Conantokin-Gm; Short=Con-Gm [Conus gloriamaris]